MLDAYKKIAKTAVKASNALSGSLGSTTPPKVEPPKQPQTTPFTDAMQPQQPFDPMALMEMQAMANQGGYDQAVADMEAFNQQRAMQPPPVTPLMQPPGYTNPLQHSGGNLLNAWHENVDKAFAAGVMEQILDRDRGFRPETLLGPAGHFITGHRPEAAQVYDEWDAPSFNIPLNPPQEIMHDIGIGRESPKVQVGVKGSAELLNPANILLPMPVKGVSPVYKAGMEIAETGLKKSVGFVDEAVQTSLTRGGERGSFRFGRDEIKASVLDDMQVGGASDKYLYHTSGNINDIVNQGLHAGGLAGNPVLQQGYGDVVHVFLRSDISDEILKRGRIFGDVAYEPLWKPVKPRATFTVEELGVKEADRGFGARASELGYELEPPMPNTRGETLAIAKMNSDRIAQIEDAYSKGVIGKIIGGERGSFRFGDEGLEEVGRAIPEGGTIKPLDVPPVKTATPEQTLGDIFTSIPGENVSRAAVRMMDGARGVAAGEVDTFWKQGVNKLRQLGLGKRQGSRQILTREEMEPLYLAVHGEGPVPPSMQGIYDDMKTLMKQETDEMVAYDPGYTAKFMAHPDYFYRGWKSPKTSQVGTGGVGAQPGFLKPRNKATFKEMLDMGWEPLSWNPYDMAAIRRLHGVEYREGLIFIDRLKKVGEALPVVAKEGVPVAPKEGWRVPKIGPAFEGKPYVLAGTDEIAYTPKIAVPNEVANILESIYGTGVGKGFTHIKKFSDFTKRSKLFMSLFQHIDFINRSGFTALTPTGISKGAPIKYPHLVARLANVSLNPRARGGVMERIMSGKVIDKDLGISLKDVAKQGWQIGGDTSLIRRGIAQELDSVVKSSQPNLLSRAGEMPRRVAEFFESGLFDGVYRESQSFALENFIIPNLKRIHPEWTGQQIAASAAEEVNKIFSTLGVWQSVFHDPTTREALRVIAFSANESESLIRQATSMVPITIKKGTGKLPTISKTQNARLWGEYAIGTMLWLTIMGNAINLAFTGKPMPIERYMPVKTGDKYAPDWMPGGAAYNTDFMSPEIFGGMKLDLVGQADTFFRWALDPWGAAASRTNVVPRAIINQIEGETFWGEQLETPLERATQAGVDLFMPISGGNVAEAIQKQFPDQMEWYPSGEASLPTEGSLIQATGVNVRAQRTGDILDDAAKDSGLISVKTGQPATSRDELTDKQWNTYISEHPEVQEELDKRQSTSFGREQDWAVTQEKIKGYDAEYHDGMVDHLNQLDKEVVMAERAGESGYDAARKFRTEISEEGLRRSTQLGELFPETSKIMETFEKTGKWEGDPFDVAMTQYRATYEANRIGNTGMDWEGQEEMESIFSKRWTPEQKAWIDGNTGNTEYPPELQEFFDMKKELAESGYYNQPDTKSKKAFRSSHHNVERILTSKYWGYVPLSEQGRGTGSFFNPSGRATPTGWGTKNF